MIAYDHPRGIEASSGTPYASTWYACVPRSVAPFDAPLSTLSRSPEIR